MHVWGNLDTCSWHAAQWYRVLHKTAITIAYYHTYHRCVYSGKGSNIEMICLYLAPFSFILLMYCLMLGVIIRSKRWCGRFLITARGIIMTSLLSYSPTVIASFGKIPLSYQVLQILTVTVFYTNGIVNPLIYLASHPVTREQVRSWWTRNNNSGAVLTQLSTNRSAAELSQGESKPSVSMPSISLRADPICSRK